MTIMIMMIVVFVSLRISLIQLWISMIQLWIHISNYRYQYFNKNKNIERHTPHTIVSWPNDIHNSITDIDIHNWISNIHNCIFLIPHIHNWVKDINNWITDIHDRIIYISIIELWISIFLIMDIHNWIADNWFMEIVDWIRYLYFNYVPCISIIWLSMPVDIHDWIIDIMLYP